MCRIPQQRQPPNKRASKCAWILRFSDDDGFLSFKGINLKAKIGRPFPFSNFCFQEAATVGALLARVSAGIVVRGAGGAPWRIAPPRTIPGIHSDRIKQGEESWSRGRFRAGTMPGAEFVDGQTLDAHMTKTTMIEGHGEGIADCVLDDAATQPRNLPVLLKPGGACLAVDDVEIQRQEAHETKQQQQQREQEQEQEREGAEQRKDHKGDKQQRDVADITQKEVLVGDPSAPPPTNDDDDDDDDDDDAGGGGTRRKLQAPEPTRRCAYLTSTRYAELAKRLPRNSERAGLVESLVEATGVLERMCEVVEVVASLPPLYRCITRPLSTRC